LLNTNQEMMNQIKKFWEIENINNIPEYTEEENFCERLFSSTTKHDEDGRFVVQLPTKTNIKELKDNRSTATRKFHQMEKSLQQNVELREMYIDFIDEYIKYKHMDEVNEIQTSSNEIIHYIPHHSVHKPTSTTTKLRDVFNASCKASNNIALNDVLCVGPVVQRELLEILLRFCQHQYACIGNIKIMYRQIFIDPQQRNLQRILWRSNPTDPIKDYA
jgi:hypothetical protein